MISSAPETLPSTVEKQDWKKLSQVKVVHMTSVHTAVDIRIFQKECRSLARAGFQVTSIGSHSSDTVIDHVSIKSVKRDQARLTRMTRTVWRVYREAMKQSGDVYHFHDPELIPIGLLLRANGKHVIYDLHEDYPKDILSKSYLPLWTRIPIAWMMKQLENVSCRHFSAVVTVTPSIADRFRSVNKRTVVVHNFPSTKDLVTSRSVQSWDSRRQSVAYVGGIMGVRSIYEMVEAMSLIPSSFRATLELAGPHPDGEPTVAELSRKPGWERVYHHGFINQLSTFDILHNVRAGLVLFHPIPNHMEAMPQKIFEYMGAGLPVIASDFPLWRRIIGDSGSGIFVDPKDPRAIAQAIEYILSHPTEAEEMGRRGREAVLKHYNWDVQAERLVKLYSEIVNPLCVA
ncbi:MAG TPA: glycosyltransferase family 4 protein [Candidatus Saccharimonadales bacterium]|nr:glycosyltransferase family 4 protein [Candidatus Saccharimonadales bacterium]